MNGKQCKRLRRQAEVLTVGLPARKLVTWRQRATNPRHNPGVIAEAALNDPQTTRGVYRELKRQFKAGTPVSL
jgi:hypothetical protein